MKSGRFSFGTLRVENSAQLDASETSGTRNEPVTLAELHSTAEILIAKTNLVIMDECPETGNRSEIAICCLDTARNFDGFKKGIRDAFTTEAVVHDLALVANDPWRVSADLTFRREWTSNGATLAIFYSEGSGRVEIQMQGSPVVVSEGSAPDEPVPSVDSDSSKPLEEKQNKQSTPGAIGRWSIPGGFTCQISKSNSEDLYNYRMFGSDGSVVWDKKRKKAGDRLTMIDGPFGEYYKIDNDGNLRAYDREGMIDTYRRMR